jgi:hypothetical protein
MRARQWGAAVLILGLLGGLTDALGATVLITSKVICRIVRPPIRYPIVGLTSGPSDLLRGMSITYRNFLTPHL